MQIGASIIEAGYSVRSSHGLITLDVEQDQYSCIYDPPAGEERQFIPPASGSSPTWIALPEPAARTLSAGDVAYFLLAMVGAAIELRSHSFADLLRAQAARRTPSSPAHIDAVATVALRFKRLERWLPIRYLCFFRAIFLLRFLRRYGLTADWVFGAALFPFDAHCWLAAGPYPLTDRPDRLVRFEILLKIEGTVA